MIKVLFGLLALQVVMAGAIFVGKQQQVEYDTDLALIEFSADQVDKIVIEGEESSTIIEKSGEGWVLPDLQGLPVMASKVDEVLEKLAEVKRGWPVASSKSSQTRLEVAEDSFQRKIGLSLSDGQEKNLIMGTSPGYRSIHARMTGEDDVFTVNLATYDFPDAHDAWLDRSLLDVKELSKIVANDVAIEKIESEWQLVTGPVPAQGEALLDPEEVEHITGLFEDITVLGVAENSPGDSEAIDVSVSGAQGNWVYQFFNDEDNSYVRRNDRDTVFRVSKSSYEKVLAFNLENLVLEDQPIADDQEESQPENG